MSRLIALTLCAEKLCSVYVRAEGPQVSTSTSCLPAIRYTVYRTFSEWYSSSLGGLGRTASYNDAGGIYTISLLYPLISRHHR